MLNHALNGAESVAITGHIRPDGDCVGSCLGLYHYLVENRPDLQVDVFLEEIPESLEILEGTDEIKHELPETAQYDLLLALDCAGAERVGFAGELFAAAKKIFIIDHHISNVSLAEGNYIIPEASSTSELVYQLINKDKISKKIAECLYLGIVHDTGVFQYTCTSPETMEAAANLMRHNIRASEIISKSYFEKTYEQNKILGRALDDSRLELDGKCIVSWITSEQMQEYNVRPKDLDGIVSQLRMTKDVEVSIFLYETAAGEYKISLRASGDVNVSKVAQYFGGGGHVKAAGASMKGAPENIIQKILEQIQLQL